MHVMTIGDRRPNPPVRGLIFDLDGTIADTRRYHMAAWLRFGQRLGLGARFLEVAERGFGKTNWAIFDEAFAGGRDAGEFDRLSEEKEAIFRRLIAGRARPRPGLRALLALGRRRGVRTAVATSGPRANAEFMLEDLGLRRQFDAVVWGDAAIRSKPHPDSFLRAARRLGVTPPQCVGFEDSSHGCWAVRRAGMRLVAIAERPLDLVGIRKWSAWVFQDFRPAVDLAREEWFARNGAD
jgi:HAD superfamily hydrolase (TIGR01509 family)